MNARSPQYCPRDEAGFCIGGLWGICPGKPELCSRKEFNDAWDRRYAALKAQASKPQQAQE